MPDHVRNPHKYTCYALEEPLTVGGGDATANGAQAEMEQVLRCVSPLPLMMCCGLSSTDRLPLGLQLLCRVVHVPWTVIIYMHLCVWQAQRAAHSLAAVPGGSDVEVVEQMQHLPEFGSGIGFCPTGKRSRDSRPAAGESTAVASSAAALQQRFVEEEEVLQVWADLALALSPWFPVVQ